MKQQRQMKSHLYHATAYTSPTLPPSDLIVKFIGQTIACAFFFLHFTYSVECAEKNNSPTWHQIFTSQKKKERIKIPMAPKSRTNFFFYAHALLQ